MTFGEKLLKLRKERGLSQEELAAQLAVSRQTISRWELGSSMPDTENIVQLSSLFHLSADYLIRDEIEDELNVAAQKEEAPKPEKGSAKILLILSIVFGGIGALGQCAIYLLSTMVLLQVPNEAVPDGADTTYMADIWAREYGNFIAHYHLETVSNALWCLLAAGLVLFVLWLIMKKVKHKQPDNHKK